MIDYKQELYEDLDQLRDYVLAVKGAANDILDWIHVIENDMQSFIDCRFPDVNPEQEKSKSVLLPMEEEFLPGSDCIDPDGEGCKCYVGCTADCLPSEYKACKCPRKVAPAMTPESNPNGIRVENGYYVVEPDLKPQSDPTEFDDDDGELYTLTDKGCLIVRLINEGVKYPVACEIADEIFKE